MDLSIKRTFQAGALALKKHKDSRHFKYFPLSPNRRQIRVIILSPGRYCDELRAEIRLVEIDEPHHLRYEAVSHSCAATTGGLKPIKVSITRRLWVQPTIAVMLQHLRYKDENRVLWIDELCINQDDLNEKSFQAAIVTDIFKAAERAVVWLGPEGADSGNALSLLEDLGWMVEFDFDNLRMRPSAAGIDDPSWADPNEELPYDQDGIWSVYELIYRTWFGRVGSRQEISAKSNNATVLCGFRAISWDILRAALGCFANKPRAPLESPDSPAELRFTRRYEMILLICQTNKVHTLSDLLEQSRKFSCPNPLDRIYSVLSLATDIDRSMGFLPNYNLSKAELYRSTTVRHISYTKTVNILASCEGLPTALDAGDMPSWVPDWTRKRLASAMPLHFASSHSEARVVVDGRALRVQAILCGTVESAVDLFTDYIPPLRAAAALRRCAPLDVLSSPYDATCSMLEAYCATLAWGLFSCLHAPLTESYPNFEASIGALRRLLALPTDPVSLGSAAQGTLDVDLLTYVTHIIGCCKGRSVFSTSDGFLGLALKEVQPDDLVWVLLGCDVPLILRPSTGPSGGTEYRIVGECYVHGLMTGEAILGLLPPDCRLLLEGDDGAEPLGPVVARTAGSGPVADANSAGSHVTLETEDPRLLSLRAKLREADIDATSMTADELLQPSILRAAGVKVQDIELN